MDKKEQEVLETTKLCAIWLVKNLCLDTNATTAKWEGNITEESEDVGRYKIVIKKVKDK